jgi:PGF-pre-PGF domain-containing protein
LPDIAHERVTVITRGGAVVSIPRIAAQQRASASLSEETIFLTGVTDVSFTAKKNLTNVSIKVEKLVGKPEGVQNPVRNALRYLNISLENATASDITDAVIQFRIAKSELQGMNPSDIALARFANGVWGTLTTSLKGSDADYYAFEAETPGFSYFAVLGLEPAAVTSSVCATTCPTGQTQTAYPDCGCAAPLITPKADNTWIFLVVIMLVVAGIYYWYSQQKPWSRRKR